MTLPESEGQLGGAPGHKGCRQPGFNSPQPHSIGSPELRHQDTGSKQRRRSPSSPSAVWVVCPSTVFLEEKGPSPHMREGKAAHLSPHQFGLTLEGPSTAQFYPRKAAARSWPV